MNARDEHDRLICQYPDGLLPEQLLSKRPLKPCGAKINAMTGLMELQKLAYHLKRKHLIVLNMNNLLELRHHWETNEAVVGTDDAKALKALAKRRRRA